MIPIHLIKKQKKQIIIIHILLAKIKLKKKKNMIAIMELLPI